MFSVESDLVVSSLTIHKLGPCSKEGRKLVVIQFIRVPQQLEVSIKALRD